MKKKRTRNPVITWREKVWKVFSLYIRNRDNWTCCTCGKHEKSSQMHAGHFVRRWHNATLFDERNVNAQCSGCNNYKDGEGSRYAEFLESKYGFGIVQELNKKSREIKKFTVPELQELYKKYSELVKSF